MKTMLGGTPPPSNHKWAADSGCYGNNNFNWVRYYNWLLRKLDSDCLFFTIPDTVGDAVKTLEQFNMYIGLLSALPGNKAFVAQDNIEAIEVPWNKFEVLFIGGTTEWKIGEIAKEVIAEGQSKNKWIHIGRVNTIERMEHFAKLQVNSVDGTYAMFGPDKNIPKLIERIKKINEEYYTS